MSDYLNLPPRELETARSYLLMRYATLQVELEKVEAEIAIIDEMIRHREPVPVGFGDI